MTIFFLVFLQRCDVDDDAPSYVGTDSFTAATESQEIKGPIINASDINNAIVHEEVKAKKVETAPVAFDFSKRLSCKWSTGAGPRIGCVRDYPEHLQSRALEQVNLSPRPASARPYSYGPIPSPRPSPKVRISPRLAYMGLPSPRTPISAAS